MGLFLVPSQTGLPLAWRGQYQCCWSPSGETSLCPLDSQAVYLYLSAAPEGSQSKRQEDKMSVDLTNIKKIQLLNTIARSKMLGYKQITPCLHQCHHY